MATVWGIGNLDEQASVEAVREAVRHRPVLFSNPVLDVVEHPGKRLGGLPPICRRAVHRHCVQPRKRHRERVRLGAEASCFGRLAARPARRRVGRGCRWPAPRIHRRCRVLSGARRPGWPAPCTTRKLGLQSMKNAHAPRCRHVVPCALRNVLNGDVVDRLDLQLQSSAPRTRSCPALQKPSPLRPLAS